MHNIGQGEIDIPALWHDQSVNVFTSQPPGAPGMSITVNRDRLPLATTLPEYAQSQFGKLARQLKGFRLIEQGDIELDGRPAYLCEFAWHTDDMGPVHQVLLCVADGALVLNMAATQGGQMSDPQRVHARQILQSFRFGPGANAIVEAPQPPG